jgi:ketosteroid isomerase-like protein
LSEGGQDNVELVRDAYAAFARGGINAVLPFITEDVTIHSIPEWPDDSEYHGHEGFRKLTVAWTDHFEGWGFDIEDVRDAGEDVVALLRMKGEAKVSGMSIAAELGAVYSRISDGRVGEIRFHSSWREALTAAGLDPATAGE